MKILNMPSPSEMASDAVSDTAPPVEVIVKRIIPEANDPRYHEATLAWKSHYNGRAYGEYDTLQHDPTEEEIQDMLRRGVEVMAEVAAQ